MWIVPIVTLIVSIQVYGYDRGAGGSRLRSRRQPRCRPSSRVTLPQILPGIVSGALFAFLLSWSNLPLSAYTTGVDTTLPEWLFSRMSTNYAPMVPAVAVMSILGSIVFVLVWQSVRWALLRRRADKG